MMKGVFQIEYKNFQNGIEAFNNILVLISANQCSFVQKCILNIKKQQKYQKKDNIGVAKVKGPENRMLFELYNYSFFPLLTFFIIRKFLLLS